MNLLEQFEAEQKAKLTDGKTLPDFGPGDTLRVNVKVVEGTRERVQAYEGVCIALNRSGLNTSFTVRKISYGEGVERVFPLYSPRIDSIQVVRRLRWLLEDLAGAAPSAYRESISAQLKVLEASSARGFPEEPDIELSRRIGWERSRPAESSAPIHP